MQSKNQSNTTSVWEEKTRMSDNKKVELILVFVKLAMINKQFIAKYYGDTF